MAATIYPLGALDPRAAPFCGRKSLNLARLRSAGLPVLDGIVVGEGEVDSGPLVAACNHLGKRLIVRSSSMAEDNDDDAAPGIFDSFADVRLEQLAERVDDVRRSARSERARAYAHARGQPFPSPMAVLIQPYVQPAVWGTVYTRSSSASDDLVVEVVSADKVAQRSVARTSTATTLLGVADHHFEQLIKASIEIEAIVGGPRGADIEWLIGDGTLWIAQARRLSAFVADERNAPELAAFAFANAEGDDEWHWDIAHNPLPLSAAQKGLVELVAEELGAPLAVACGYLYERLEPGHADRSRYPQLDAAQLADSLETLFFSQLVPQLNVVLSEVECRETGLDAALAAYLRINSAYSNELRPLLSQARALAPAKEPLGIGIALLQAIAAPESGFGAAARELAGDRSLRGSEWYWAPYAPRWDVNSPCFGEDATTLAHLVAALPATKPKTLSATHEARATSSRLARVVYAVSELDDRLFYRAQRAVRKAIQRLPGEPSIVRFDLDLATLREWELTGAPPKGARERAHAHAATREENATLRMPLTVRGGQLIWSPLQTDRRILRGIGSGPPRSGHVTRTGGLAGAVLVASDLTPGEVIRAMGAEAIVLERGHLLGHAAALARELGIPLVTNVAGATTILREGERIWIDADAGIVVRSREE